MISAHVLLLLSEIPRVTKATASISPELLRRGPEVWAAWDGSAHHGGHLFLRPPWAGAWKYKSRSLMEEGLLSLKILHLRREYFCLFSPRL